MPDSPPPLPAVCPVCGHDDCGFLRLVGITRATATPPAGQR